MGLTRLSARIVAARPLRSFLTIIGVALGVGVLSASLSLGARLDEAISRTVRDLVGNADLRVSSFLERGLSDATVDEIRTVDGVTVVAATVERRTFLAGVPGTTAGAVTVLGVDPTAYLELHPVVLVAGAPLARIDEPSAMITERLAASAGYVVGSELTIQGAGAPVPVRVVGIIEGGGPEAGASGRTVIVPLDVARAVFAPNGVTRVDIGLAPGVTVATAASMLAERITTEPYVLASPADIAAGLRASTADVRTTIGWLAAIILFVGAFLIINTVSMTVGERAREVGLLRAAGATRGQIFGFVLVGAGLIGLIGSALGLAVGFGLSVLVAGSVRALSGFAAPVEGLDVASLVIALIVGLVVTVAAAFEPAIRASRIAPVEAMRAPLDVSAVRRGRLIWLTAVLAFVVIIALIAWPPTEVSSGAGGALAVYVVLLVATLTSPFILGPLARIIGIPLSYLVRLEERLARGSFARDRSRTALTLGALVIGLAMVVALGWTAQAARQRATEWLADVVPGDEVVTSIRPIPADERVREALAGVAGVRSVSPIATFDLALKGVRIDAAAVVGADFLEDGRLTFTEGDRATALAALDAGGSAIVPASAADRLGLRVGDHISLALGTGTPLDLRIAGVVERSIPSGGGEAILVGWPDALGPIGVTGANVFAVRFEPGAAGTARPALESTARTLALEANPLERIQGAVTEALGRVFGLFDALALIALLVAALGIVNTLGMGVLERVREIGLLRAIGMSRSQASRMVVTEGLILGLVGTVLGVAVGLMVGAVLLSMSGAFDGSVTLPWSSIAAAAGLGLASSVVASYYPSLVASRVSIVRALKFN
ncbi:MAG: ABC transporter permease [Chloroflexi bacterium]|nr:ABC transporter permease [Chloroflexota bacterium]